jgi:arylsulfatase A-like enzyme
VEDWKKRIVVGVGAFALLGVGAGVMSLRADLRRSSAPRDPSGPNVLIIMTDDQRLAGTFSVLPKTKRWFAEGGTSFTRAYATTPLCCPSRASIMTGRYAHNHRVRENVDTDLLDQSSTLQRYLQDAGYRTAIFGKFLNGWALQSPPHFDEWSIGRLSDYYGGRFNTNGEKGIVGGYLTDYVADAGVSFLEGAERDDARPWLMYLTPYAPHVPAIPEVGYEHAPVPRWKKNPAVEERDVSDKPAYVPSARADLYRMRGQRARQLRTLMSVDDLVDDVLRAVKRLGEQRETLAIFLSDNGYTWAEHRLYKPSRQKRTPYRESARIPLMLRWPGHVEGNVRDERLVANIDIVPTVLDAAGLERDAAGLDGRSLLGSGARRELLLEHWKSERKPIPEWASILTSSYQYVEYYGEGRREPSFAEYYRLSEDPWQLRNLLADGDTGNDPDVGALAERLMELRSCRGEGCP